MTGRPGGRCSVGDVVGIVVLLAVGSLAVSYCGGWFGWTVFIVCVLGAAYIVVGMVTGQT